MAIVAFGVFSALLPLAVALAARRVLSPSVQEAGFGEGARLSRRFHPHRMMSDPMPSQSFQADPADVVRTGASRLHNRHRRISRCALHLTGE